MAFATSYVSGRTLRDALMGIDVPAFPGNEIKAALFTNAGTAGVKHNLESYGQAPYNAAEVSPTDTGYTTGGKVLASCSFSTPVDAGGGLSKWVFDTTDATTAWGPSPLATFSAQGVVIYNNTLANKRVLAAINFTTLREVVGGTFTITWDAVNGLFYSTF